MEQRCYLAAVWLTWLGLPLLAVVVGLRLGVVAAVFILAVGIVGQVLYLRWFPYVSRWIGYGSVADTPADPAAMAGQLPRVTLGTRPRRGRRSRPAARRCRRCSSASRR